MRIITKIKDYYDYLQGVYGIDDKVIYDRRDAIYIDPSRGCMDMGLECLFNPDYKLSPSCHRSNDFYGFGLEIGYIRYVISVFRGKDGDKFEYEIKEKKKLNKDDKVSSAPIVLYHIRSQGRWNRKNDDDYVPLLNRDGSGYYNNPILIKTFIPGLIPAEEIWQNLYDYISSLNEVEVIDTRTNIQHVESHGFDKKVSFRHRKG